MKAAILYTIGFIGAPAIVLIYHRMHPQPLSVCPPLTTPESMSKRPSCGFYSLRD